MQWDIRVQGIINMQWDIRVFKWNNSDCTSPTKIQIFNETFDFFLIVGASSRKIKLSSGSCLNWSSIFSSFSTCAYKMVWMSNPPNKCHYGYHYLSSSMLSKSTKHPVSFKNSQGAKVDFLTYKIWWKSFIYHSMW